jgi:uncharacterized membrane protein YqiK
MKVKDQQEQPQAPSVEAAQEIAELKARLAKAEAEKEAALKTAQEAEEAKAKAEADAETAKAEAEAAIAKAEADADALADKTLHDLRAQKKYVLTINSTETEKSPVQLGINGVAYSIRRDEECLVPKSVINVLECAVVKNAMQQEVEGRIVTRFVATKRYSFNYREATPEDESKFVGK